MPTIVEFRNGKVISIVCRRNNLKRLFVIKLLTALSTDIPTTITTPWGLISLQIKELMSNRCSEAPEKNASCNR